MAGTTDKAKGRAKVAAGAVTGDKSLEQEGRIDRLAGDTKDKIAEASGVLGGWLDTAGTKATEALNTTQHVLEDLVNKVRR